MPRRPFPARVAALPAGTGNPALTIAEFYRLPLTGALEFIKTSRHKPGAIRRPTPSGPRGRWPWAKSAHAWNI
jgi:hypothetical protein